MRGVLILCGFEPSVGVNNDDDEEEEEADGDGDRSGRRLGNYFFSLQKDGISRRPTPPTPTPPPV